MKELNFSCPNCGDISRDEVVFLCNQCSQGELIAKDGLYVCPQCFVPGENFECMQCESKAVKFKGAHNKKTTAIEE